MSLRACCKIIGAGTKPIVQGQNAPHPCDPIRLIQLSTVGEVFLEGTCPLSRRPQTAKSPCPCFWAHGERDKKRQLFAGSEQDRSPCETGEEKQDLCKVPVGRCKRTCQWQKTACSFAAPFVGTGCAVSADFSKGRSRWKRSTGTFPNRQYSRRDTGRSGLVRSALEKLSLFSPTCSARPKVRAQGISPSADGDSGGSAPPKNLPPAALSWSSLIRKQFHNAPFFPPAFSVWRFLWKRGISLKILAFHRLSTENLRFSTPFSTACGKPMWRKSFAPARAFPDASSAAVESSVEGCAKTFPPAVEIAVDGCRIFHGFLHKFFVSTPQSFHHSTRKKSLHFSTISPQRVRGRKISADSGKNPTFHFSCPSMTATNFLILLFSIFCSSAAFLIKTRFHRTLAVESVLRAQILSDKRMDRPC